MRTRSRATRPFCVNFTVSETIDGWITLDRIARALNDASGVTLTVWHDGATTFELAGGPDTDPDDLAGRILNTGPR